MAVGKPRKTVVSIAVLLLITVFCLNPLSAGSAGYEHTSTELPINDANEDSNAASAQINILSNQYPSYFGAKSGTVTAVTTTSGTYYVQWFTNGTALLASSDGYMYYWDSSSWNYLGISWKANAMINETYNLYPWYFGTKLGDVTTATTASGTYYVQWFTNGTAILAWTDGYIYFWNGTGWNCMWTIWNSNITASNTTVSDTSLPWIAWMSTLPLKGYGVSRGNVYVVDNAACEKIVSVFGTCFGNNAAAPYIIPQVPIADTYMDTYYTNDFYSTSPNGVQSNMFYRLSDNDALVTILKLPPRAAYLGYQGYLFSRNATIYTNDNITPGAYTPDPSRAEIFGSFGNDINNVVISRQAGIQWDGSSVVYITTSNKTLRDTLVADAKASGLNTNLIFTEPIGANIITGHSASADDFGTLIRYALPDNETLSNLWKQTVQTNILVYRVSNLNVPVSRYATPAYTPKEGSSESMYQSSLSELSTILARWLEVTKKRPTITENMITSDNVTSTGELIGLAGANCIAKGTSCLGDDQDTDAYRLGIIGKLQGTDLAIVTGVNHALTGAASYVSLAIYNMDTFDGVASASQTNPQAVGFNSGMLTGSAEAVLRQLNLYDSASNALKAQLPMLYVTLISRQCEYAADYCVALTDTTDLPLSSRISVTQRAYVKPGTTSGANPDTLLTPQVIITP
ncbi:hypothetical protein [Candidatus Magnetominusculus dajiuhuensis]|uniref:hypothetical protein n=1 Tax=Candidatus Magnetominusculus dajiuhuensis TaxID=3137712 RepID=UPI003B437CBF